MNFTRTGLVLSIPKITQNSPRSPICGPRKGVQFGGELRASIRRVRRKAVFLLTVNYTLNAPGSANSPLLHALGFLSHRRFIRRRMGHLQNSTAFQYLPHVSCWQVLCGKCRWYTSRFQDCQVRAKAKTLSSRVLSQSREKLSNAFLACVRDTPPIPTLRSRYSCLLRGKSSSRPACGLNAVGNIAHHSFTRD
jgi:hypothetical protein